MKCEPTCDYIFGTIGIILRGYGTTLCWLHHDELWCRIDAPPRHAELRTFALGAHFYAALWSVSRRSCRVSMSGVSSFSRPFSRIPLLHFNATCTPVRSMYIIVYPRTIVTASCIFACRSMYECISI